MRRGVLFVTLMIAALVSIHLPAAEAQNYPNRPVKLLVGAAPGSTIDIVGRVVAEGLRARFGQPFVVENKTGANGMLAAETVARSGPDGYTILVGFASQISVNPHVYANIRYDVEKDFAPVTPVVAAPFVLLVNPANPKTAPVKSLHDLIALAKEKPGGLTYGSAGVGSMVHLVGAQFSSAMDLQTVHVPYRGAAPMETGLIGGEVDYAFDNLSGVPLARDGRLRALAVTGTTRWPDLPDVPTVSELGLPATMNISSWFGILVPAGTPDKIVQLLNREIIAAIAVPGARERLVKFGLIATMSPPAFAAQIKAELHQYGELVKRLSIKLE
jgi:tripartite-type tricarboxylate transporter receptor subunit TctC